MSALGKERNSIKTGAKSAMLYIPENYSSCVNRDMLILLAKFSANYLHQMFSREKAPTRSRTTHRLRLPCGHHAAVSTNVQPCKLPMDMHKIKKILQSYSKSQGMIRWYAKISFNSSGIKLKMLQSQISVDSMAGALPSGKTGMTCSGPCSLLTSGKFI